MAKITLENGMVIEGTIEELKQMGMKFPVEAEEQSPKYKQIDGADVRVGDFVKFIDYKCDTTVGRYYEITGFDSDGDPTFKDDEADTVHVFTHDDDAEFYRLVAGTHKEQAEEVAEEEPGLKVGDFVRLNIKDSESPYYGWGAVKNGDVGEIKGVYERKVVVDFENQSGWNGKPTELTLLTDEELDLKIGDFAKVVSVSSAMSGFDIGDIAEVAGVGKRGVYRIEVKKGGVHGYGDINDHLVRATGEEIAAAKAQAEAKREAAKWEKIGRKPGEYKKGDIVRVIDGSNSSQENGNIGEIAQVDNDDTPYRVNSIGITSGNFLRGDNIELITPVESRFDLAMGGDQEDAK